MGATRRSLALVQSMAISIHAPAMGATWLNRKTQEIVNFNPRARDGRDAVSPSSRRVWRYFNPRARDGRDLADLDGRLLPDISIHAPAMGATRRAPRRRKEEIHFNPRARDGRDKSYTERLRE